jgi:uncharacterized protein
MKQSRIEVVDAIRGFALLGVFLANVPYDSTVTTNETENFISLLMDLLVHQKFIAIFSILFGFGFYVQLNKTKKATSNFNTYYIKRMAVLFGIGTIHCYVFWNGDILMSYAISGVCLLFIKPCSVKQLLIFSFCFGVLLTGGLYIGNAILDWKSYNYDYSLAYKINTVPSITQYLHFNFITAPWSNFFKDVPITIIYTYGSMLLGVVLGKIHFFKYTNARKKLYNALVLLGCTFGLIASYLFFQINAKTIVFDISMWWLPFVIIMGMLLQSMAYLALFVKLYQTLFGNRILKWLVAIGRTALTNYVGQSVFYLLVIYHCTHLFQFYGKISRLETYLLVVVFFSFQLTNSRLWLKIKTMGPLEYLWRKIIYPSK